MFSIFKILNEILWGYQLVVVYLLTGLYFSYRTRFVQFRYLRKIKSIFRNSNKNESSKGTSSFQAFIMTLSGHVGTGNITGVATAIYFGGPGALFWMWAMACVGAASSFIETVLAQIFKEEVDGQFRGGPAYYIEKGLGHKWFAVLFAFMTTISIGLLFPGIQANSIADSMYNAFKIDKDIITLILVALVGIIIFGGVKRIARISEIVVPIMASLYIVLAIIIIGVNFNELGNVFRLIFSSAFDRDSLFGGIAGSAIIWGVKRGLVSNEAGMGTAPNLAASADVSHPVKQGIIQSMSVYVDTLFVCTATGIMILITGKYNVIGSGGNNIFTGLPGIIEPGTIFSQEAINTVFSNLGSYFVAIAIFFFAFTTILALYYQAETNLLYIFSKRENNYLTVLVLRIATIGAIIYGTRGSVTEVWTLADIGVATIAWLNIVAILLLQKPALEALDDYERQSLKNKEPQYRPPDYIDAPTWKKR